MANEYPDADDENPNWYHYFLCQSWTPGWSGAQIKICFQSMDDDIDGTGLCYVERISVPCYGQ